MTRIDPTGLGLADIAKSIWSWITQPRGDDSTAGEGEGPSFDNSRGDLVGPNFGIGLVTNEASDEDEEDGQSVPGGTQGGGTTDPVPVTETNTDSANKTARDNDEMHNFGGGTVEGDEAENTDPSPNEDSKNWGPEFFNGVPDGVSLPSQTETPYSDYPHADTACYFLDLIAIPQIVLGIDLTDNQMKSIAETLMKTEASFQPPDAKATVYVMNDLFNVQNPDDTINLAFSILQEIAPRSRTGRGSVGGNYCKGVLAFYIIKNETKYGKHYQLADLDMNIIYDSHPGLDNTSLDVRPVYINVPRR